MASARAEHAGEDLSVVLGIQHVHLGRKRARFSYCHSTAPAASVNAAPLALAAGGAFADRHARCRGERSELSNQGAQHASGGVIR